MLAGDTDQIFPVTDNSRLLEPSVLEAYLTWDRLRGSRPMPSRKEFSPAALARHLALIGLIDVIDGGRDYRFRVLGSRVDNIMQGRFTGSLVSDYPHAESRRHVHKLYTLVTTSGLPHLSTGRLGQLKLEYIRYASLVLPLANEDGQVIQLLVANHFETVVKGHSC